MANVINNKPGFKNAFFLNIFPSPAMLKGMTDSDMYDTVWKVIKKAAAETWTLDGYDPITRKHNSQLLAVQGLTDPRHRSVVNMVEGNKINQANEIAIIASFVGLPTNVTKRELLTWRQVGRDFCGLDTTDSYVKRTGIILKNSVKALFVTTANILRIFTEFLPKAIENANKFALAHAYDSYLDAKRDEDLAKQALFGTAIALLIPPLFISKLWFVAGRAWNSPNDSWRAGWQVGKEIGGIPGTIVGGTLAALSMVLSAVEWGLTSPYLLFSAGAAIGAIPQIGPHILNGFNIAANWIMTSNVTGSVMNTLNSLGQSIMPALNPITTIINVQASTLAIGISAAAVTIASPIKYFLNHPKRVIRNAVESVQTIIKAFSTTEKAESSLKQQEKQEVTYVPNAGISSKRTLELLGQASPYNSNDEDDEQLHAVISNAKQSQKAVENKGIIASAASSVSNLFSSVANYLSSSTSSNQPSNN